MVLEYWRGRRSRLENLEERAGLLWGRYQRELRQVYAIREFLEAIDTKDRTICELGEEFCRGNEEFRPCRSRFYAAARLVGFRYLVSRRIFRQKPNHKQACFFALKEIICRIFRSRSSTFFFDATTFCFETNPRRAWQNSANKTSFFSSTNYLRYHLLMVLGAEGVFAFQVVLGKVPSSAIFAFLHEVAAVLRADPGVVAPTLVLDNATVHKTQLMKRLARCSGLTFVFTAYHSPFMNPIEEAFRFLKSEYRNLHAINELAN